MKSHVYSFSGHLSWAVVTRLRLSRKANQLQQISGGGTVAHTITDDCTNCGACEDACPVNAISEQSGKRVIDADTCIDCGACVDSCPVSAIHA
jgi:ferredoxin